MSDTVGVIVGRFQVPALHEGHMALLRYVIARHKTVLVVLGSPRTKGFLTARDPLSFDDRKVMMLEQFPHVIVEEIFDHPISPKMWSKDLDALIAERFAGRHAVLYGSRDSFLAKYSGTNETRELPSSSSVSGTTLRGLIGPPSNEAERRGKIHTTQTRPPVTYRSADIAVIRGNEILLITKDIHTDGERQFWSFPGGMVNKGETDMHAGARELSEEVPGITVSPLRYIDSHPVDDPRYRGTPDSITTALFRTNYLAGEPSAGDDADRVKWFRRDIFVDALVPWHRPLGELMLTYWFGRRW